MLWRGTGRLGRNYAFQNPTNRPIPRLRLIERSFGSSAICSKSNAVEFTRGPPHVKHARLLGDGKTYFQDQLDGELKVTGLVRSIRKQKHVAFAHISDGTTLEPIQAIVSPELAKNISNGAYVELLGKWQPSPAKGQAHELHVTAVTCVGESISEENPIQKQSMSVDHLRSIPHLRVRTAFQSLVTRARSQMLHSVSQFFDEGHPRHGAVQIQPPLITSSDCEGAGEVFTLTPKSSILAPGTDVKSGSAEKSYYFREPKYLTVSSQLHLEAYAAELGNVWALSPTFRAEESDTPRHLAEFYMLEAEYRGVTRVEAVTGRVSKLIASIAISLAKHRTGKELLDFQRDPKHRPANSEAIDLEERWNKLTGDYHTVSYTDAVEALQKAHETSNGTLFKSPPQWSAGLQLEHERWIVDNLGQQNPTFVVHYPKAIKPFYMLASSVSDFHEGLSENARKKLEETVACFDLLLPYGYCEVVGGSLREHRLDQLISNMREKGLLKSSTSSETQYPHLQSGESLGNLQWYADLRRYGSSPHGGFGLGFDRLLAYLTGTHNIRDVVGFPRAWGRAEC